jgi:hypothetical protein
MYEHGKKLNVIISKSFFVFLNEYLIIHFYFLIKYDNEALIIKIKENLSRGSLKKLSSKFLFFI